MVYMMCAQHRYDDIICEEHYHGWHPSDLLHVAPPYNSFSAVNPWKVVRCSFCCFTWCDARFCSSSVARLCTSTGISISKPTSATRSYMTRICARNAVESVKSVLSLVRM
ncbi:hypothetical protein CEXT_760041 [Caerostris extrusa]|uniref:Uncharacterized protein n=1 Tax=Caerostris extrusa TaxID=172846 RepID=A0AAV4NEH4_CAEEX|nr:hypothetical protein CEXT_760041 [Caerostris extrusa]